MNISNEKQTFGIQKCPFFPLKPLTAWSKNHPVHNIGLVTENYNLPDVGTAREPTLPNYFPG